MDCLFDVKTLSHYVVNRCTVRQCPVSNLQLQKVLYFLQLYYCYKKKGSALLFPESFYSWPYGPVVPSVYEEFSEFGGRVIRKSFDNSLFSEDGVFGFLNEAIDSLCKKAPWDLVRISHTKGSPWYQVYRNGAGYKERIPNELIVKAACEGLV